MPTYRVTQYFNQANMGWSETWYKAAGNMTSLARELTAMLDYRNDLLTNRHNVLAVRVSEEGSNRKSRLFLPGDTKVDGTGVIVAMGSRGDYPEQGTVLQYDQVRACLQLELSIGSERLSMRYLAGIPDAVTKTEAATIDRLAEAKWWEFFDQYCRYMVSAGWSIKTQDKGVGNPERNVVRWVIQAAAPSQLGFSVPTGSALTVNVGDKVQVRGVRMHYDGVRAPNGTWYVDAISETAVPDHVTYYLRGATGFDASLIKVTGKVRKNLYTYVVPTTMREFRAGIHKRGRPFGSPRGRRKTIRYAA